MTKPLISIIVPSFNRAENVRDLLQSLVKSGYSSYEIIINDDPKTSDATRDIVETFKKQGLPVIYIRENHSRAQARKRGAKYARGSHLLHLDSDMQVSSGLLAECEKLAEEGYDALIIPEESFGSTFWSKCKWLEKKCYRGIDEIECLRFVKTDIYWQVGGHDEKMIFSEDKDLDLKVRNTGHKIVRTKNVILHNEGDLKLYRTVKKKLYYSQTADIFAEKYPEHFRRQSNLLRRYWIFLRNFRFVFSHPVLYAGLFYMKASEFLFGGIGYALKKMRGGYQS